MGGGGTEKRKVVEAAGVELEPVCGRERVREDEREPAGEILSGAKDLCYRDLGRKNGGGGGS
jgi:hypothetical protein